MLNFFSGMLNINQSVLSGAMDIIVIRYPDGTLKSSPFHVRFGTLKILKTKEKIVNISVNGQNSELMMRLSSSGDAYFLQELKKQDLENTPDYEKSNYVVERKNSAPVSPNRTTKNENVQIQKVESLDNIGNENHENINVPSIKINSPNIKKRSLNEDLISTRKTFKMNKSDDEEDKRNEESKLRNSFRINNNLNWDYIEKELINVENANKESNQKKIFLEDSILSSEKSSKINHVEMSLCWSELKKNPENALEIFEKKKIKKDEFYIDPWKILNNQDFAIKYEDSIYTYKSAIPILMSILTFNEFPPQNVMKSLESHKHGGIFSYFKRRTSLDILKVTEKNQEIKENKEIKQKVPKKSSGYYKKSFSPTSEQLKKLGFKEGRNEVRFTVSTAYQGTHSISTDLYLWDHDSKIVISDVDGTITRSDLLGQLMPIFGKDWSHNGVVELFNNIQKNNYKILYLTARAIGQSKQTKDYLRSLSQNGVKLPIGPIIMSPDGIVSSLKREVIDRTPQKFKIACLHEILQLFPKDYLPFYAGFGNRETDAISYRAVHIELEKIFIINEKGEITQLNNAYKKSYVLLNQIVNQEFPERKNNKEIEVKEDNQLLDN